MLFHLLDELATEGAPVALGAGEYLFRRGDPAAHMYTVRSGLLRLRRCTVDGREILMLRSGPGDTVGEASLTSESYGCDAIASTATVAGRIPTRAVRERAGRDPAFALALIAAMAEQIRGERQRIEIASARRARDRVIQFLALHGDATGLFRVETTLKDIASELGLTHETFYRQLADLEREGVLTRAAGGLRLRAADL
jgi:CRP-like cAMP-binding protein